MTTQSPHEWGQPRPGVATGAATTPVSAPPSAPVNRQPVPTRSPPRRRRRRVWPWVLGLVVGGLLLMAGCVAMVVALSQAPIEAANEFVSMIDDGELQEAYNSLCAETRRSLTFAHFSEDLNVDGQITGYTLTAATAPTGGSSRISGTIRINGSVRNVAFTMTKENGAWRVCAYDPLS